MKKYLLSLLLGLGLSIASIDVLPVNALVTDQNTHYYSYNTNSNDSVGSNNGTDTNSPTYTSGKLSNALTTVAASSQYTSFSNTGLFPYGTNAYTLNLWVKFATTGGNQAICMNYNGTPGNMLFYLSSGAIVHSKGGIVDLTYTWTGIDTNWHMWTFVGDGSGMRTYLDGNSTAVASNANTSNITDWGNALPCGAYSSSGVIQAGWYLDGQSDEMGIWSRALNTTEIAELYNGGTGYNPYSGGSSPPKTMGFFWWFKRGFY